MTRRAAPRGLWVGVLAASFLLCGAALVFVVGVYGGDNKVASPRDAAPSSASVVLAPALPPPAGAFVTGGVPDTGTPTVRRVFATLLPRYVIALDAHAAAHHAGGNTRDTRIVVDAARRNLLADRVRVALGRPTLAGLRALLDAALAAAEAPHETADRRADELTSAMHGLNANLAARNLGYAVDTDVRDDDSGRRFVLIFSFAVERVRLYRSGTHAIHAVRLGRIDELGWHYNLLGFTTAERRDALIMLDQIDARLAARLLPQLDEDPPPFYALTSAERRTRWYRTLSRQVARVVKRAYAGLDPAPKRVVRLGMLLAQRGRLFRRWKARISFVAPTGLRVPTALMKNLEALTPRKEFAALQATQKKLTTMESSRVYNRSRELLIASIERHEAQHRIDHAGTRAPPMPPSLEKLTGGVRDDQGNPRPRAMRARGELSAYVAELGRDSRTSGVGLSIVTQFAIDSDFWGTAECYAALVLLDSVSVAANLDPKLPLLRDGKIDRAAVVDRYVALTELPPEALQAAARSAWKTLFGGPLAPLRLVR